MSKRLSGEQDRAPTPPSPSQPPLLPAEFCAKCKRYIAAGQGKRCLRCSRPFHAAYECSAGATQGVGFICGACHCRGCAGTAGFMLHCVACGNGYHLDCAHRLPRPDAVRLKSDGLCIADKYRWYCASCQDDRCAGCGALYETTARRCLVCDDGYCKKCVKRYAVTDTGATGTSWICHLCDADGCAVCGHVGGDRKSMFVYCRCCKKSFHQECAILPRGMVAGDYEYRTQCQREGKASQTLYDWVCDECMSCDVCFKRGSDLLLRCDVCLRRVHNDCLPAAARPGTDVLSAVRAGQTNGAVLVRVWRCDACKPRRCGLCVNVIGTIKNVVCTCCGWYYHPQCIRTQWKKIVPNFAEGFRCDNCPTEACMVCGSTAPDVPTTLICMGCLGSWHERCAKRDNEPKCHMRLQWKCKRCSATPAAASPRAGRTVEE